MGIMHLDTVPHTPPRTTVVFLRTPASAEVDGVVVCFVDSARTVEFDRIEIIEDLLEQSGCRKGSRRGLVVPRGRAIESWADSEYAVWDGETVARRKGGHDRGCRDLSCCTCVGLEMACDWRSWQSLNLIFTSVVVHEHQRYLND